MSLDYVDYSYDNIVVQLQEILQSTTDFDVLYDSETMNMLIQLFAYVGELMMYYVERRAQENYIDTAQLLSSVVNLTKLLNYTPKRKVSSTGNMLFTIASAHTKNVYIPAKTVLTAGSGKKFTVTRDTVLTAGSLTVSVECQQGDWTTYTFTGTGEASQSIELTSVSIEDSGISLFVDDVEWTAVSSFYNSISTSKHYKVLNNYDQTVTILFGDGITGNYPSLNAVIEVNALITDGVDGNLYSTDLVMTLSETLYDSSSDAVSGITVANSSKFLGGDAAEDLEEIRYEAPRVFATGDRAVTRDDYIAIMENYPGIVAANAWGENEENPPNYDMFNQVKIAILLQEWALAGTSFKADLTTYLETYAQITVRYSYDDPEIIPAKAVVLAAAIDTFSLSAVQQSIEDTLDTAFALGTISIATPIRYSAMNKLVEDTSGVDFHSLEFYLNGTIDTTDGVKTVFTGTLPLLPVKPFTLSAYVGIVNVAIDDGAGLLSGTGNDVDGTLFSAGTINYTSGTFSMTMDAAIASGSSVFSYFKQLNTDDYANDIIVEKNQIIRLTEKDVTTRYED